MVKSYKMLVLLAMLNAEQFPGSIAIDELADQVERLATRTTRAGADLGSALSDRKALIRLLEQNPIAAWAGGKGTGGVSYSPTRTARFRRRSTSTPDAAAALQELVRELAEWRLTEYLDRARDTDGRLLDAEGEPRERQADPVPAAGARTKRPTRRLDRRADRRRDLLGQLREGRHQRRPQAGDEENQLPRILRGWFGPDAGAPGTRHTVALERRGDGVAPEATRPTRWTAAALAELFARGDSAALRPRVLDRDLECRISSEAPGHIFLLVTLDKAGHGAEFQYQDHFISRSEFEWQSQNRTARRAGRPGHPEPCGARNIAVHLFVRAQKKRAGGGSAPFVYCGDVQFMSWEGEKPITVQWKLPEEVPERLREVLGVPKSEGQ